MKKSSLPDIKQIRKAAGRSDEEIVIAYGEDRIDPWWKQHCADMRKVDKLSVAMLKDAEVAQMLPLMSRTMHLTVTVQDGVVWLSDSVHTAQVQMHWLLKRD